MRKQERHKGVTETDRDRLLAIKERQISTVANEAVEAAIETDKAKSEALLLKETNAIIQRQALESKTAMEALSIELGCAREMATRNPHQNAGSIEAVTHLIKDKEEVTIEYQKQLEVIKNSGV